MYILLIIYIRNFYVHQNTLSLVLDRNKRKGLFCSKVHVGHKGTTLLFQPVPNDVGDAGDIIVHNIPKDQLNLFSFLSDSYLPVFMLITFFLIWLLLFLRFRRTIMRRTTLNHDLLKGK